MITTVTITGADDSISPRALFEMSDKYPFVEWGILVSRTSAGKRRFPSLRWIDQLVELNTERILNSKGSLKLSMHLCGAYVKELLSGDNEFITEELDDVWQAFERVQINTHASEYFINDQGLVSALEEYTDKEFIIQYDGVNGDKLITNLIGHDIKFATLFDLSHGAGVLPEKWPDVIPGVKCGYAGGIGPDNIADQMLLVNNITRNVETWVDMETKVRSDGDNLFDMSKVEKCLRTAAQFVVNKSLLGKTFEVHGQDPTDNNKPFMRVFLGANEEAVEAEANLLFGTDNVLSIKEIIK